MAEIVKECEAVSSDSFMIVPGLECETVDTTHILGIGITKPVHSKDWKTIVNEIHDQGGIAVLAHPHTFENSYDIELLELLDGIEVWNGNKDLGIPDVPTLGTISKMRRLKRRHTAFFGIDFHRQKDFKPLSLIYSDEKLSVDSLLRALKTEGYLLRSQKHDLGPLADFPFTDRAKWYAQGFLFFKSRYYAKQFPRFLDSNGITLPEAFLKIPRKFYYN